MARASRTSPIPFIKKKRKDFDHIGKVMKLANEDLVFVLRDYMREHELTTTEMSDKLAIQRVSSMLRGQFDGKLSRWVELFSILGYKVKISVTKDA